MLIKALNKRSLSLSAIITYSMNLQKEPVVKHFRDDFRLAREQVNKIGT